MTIKELRDQCDIQIRAGRGDMSVILSDDDEGNGYHDLYYSFLINQDDVRAAINSTGSWNHISECEDGYAILG